MICAANVPQWVRPLSVVTTDDVIRSGACVEGVAQWLDLQTKDRTAVSPTSRVVQQDAEAKQYIERAAHLSGDGYGCYGYGDGYGSGSGDGYEGDGADGAGAGAGEGCYDGAGAGEGCYDGAGAGEGCYYDGYGDGYGYGYGYGGLLS